MADLVIRDQELAWRLLDIARRENRSVEAVLTSLLEDYSSPQVERPAPGTFAALAQSARGARIGIDSEPTETSERSREILSGEYADYLKRRFDQ
jgi:hypothetical protein